MAVDITALYCCLDDFYTVFADWEAHRLIPSQTTRQRTDKLSCAERLFIMVLFTGIRRNMRNYLMPMADKIMLRQRFVIETVLDTLKSEMCLEHSRHRSVINAMVHVFSCLVAYACRPGKPSISLTGKQTA